MGDQCRRHTTIKHQELLGVETESLKGTRCTRTRATVIRKWLKNGWLTTRDAKWQLKGLVEQVGLRGVSTYSRILLRITLRGLTKNGNKWPVIWDLTATWVTDQDMVQEILLPISIMPIRVRHREAIKMNKGEGTIYHLMREDRMLPLDWVVLQHLKRGTGVTLHQQYLVPLLLRQQGPRKTKTAILCMPYQHQMMQGRKGWQADHSLQLPSSRQEFIDSQRT